MEVTHETLVDVDRVRPGPKRLRRDISYKHLEDPTGPLPREVILTSEANR